MFELSQPILVVENDTGAAKGFETGFAGLSIRNPLQQLCNMEEIEKYIGSYSCQKKPGLLLIEAADTRNAIEILVRFKQDSKLRLIPAVIISRETSKEDAYESFYHGAAGFIRKPETEQEWKNALKIIYTYWQICEMPGAV